MSDIQRTNYDVVLAVAIKDAERRVIASAEMWEREWTADESAYAELVCADNLIQAVRTLRRVRDGGEP